MHKITVIFVSLLIAVGALAYPVATLGSKEQRTCTVSEKDRTRDSDGNSNVRIYTEDCGVLSLQDSLIGLSFDTADKYNSIKPDQTYRFTTYGWRVTFLSMFPNIVEVEEVGK